MKYLSAASVAAFLSMVLLSAPFVQAQTLTTVFGVAEQITSEGNASQARVDALTDQARDLLNEYKTVLREVDGLRIYNDQLDRQVVSQKQKMQELGTAIDQVTVIERQITPLMLEMVDGLAQFISLDVPFLLDQRQGRIDRLRDILGRADVSVSEKFSQIMNAYTIEVAYGRTLESYTGEIDDRVVDFLRVGRVGLAYQSRDGSESGAWNQKTRAWEVLPNSFGNSITNGIRMARQQLAVGIVNLPMRGPEATQ